MPEEEKKKKPSEIPVDIDTSGPEVDVDIETKEEAVETAPETTEQETTEEVKQERWESKGVLSSLAKKTISA